MSLNKMFRILFSLSSIFFVLTVGSNEDELIVTLKNGKSLKGILQKSAYTNKDYVEFRGIPYAKPPVEELRFKNPVKYDGIWSESGPRDATNYGSICPQLNAMDMDSEDIVIGDEDCLFLNINTPKITSKKKYPVAVWIHGGSFQFENGDAYGPQKFMEHPIVLVTFNYRLNVFGFLNSDDGLIQGNMGLKDQVMVLQWVQDNIENFGGDPNQVTLFGANAGAVSTHLHMLSDMSKGLFHRAISQSGVAIAPWVLTRAPARRIEKMVKLLKCGNTTAVIYECLMKADVKKLVTNTQGYSEWYIDPLVPTGPTLELLGNEPKFLSQNPYAIIKSGKYHGKNIPWIIGVNAHEGLLHSADIVNHGVLRRVFNWEWSKAAPITLSYKQTAIDSQSISDNIWNFYFEKEEDKKSDGESEAGDSEATVETIDESEVGGGEPEITNDENPKDEVKEDIKDTAEEKTEENIEEIESDSTSKDGPVDSDTATGEQLLAQLSGLGSYEIPKLQKPDSNKISDLFVDKDNRMDEITNMYSDRYFFHPLHHTGRLHVKFGGDNPAPVYLYYFEYNGNQSIIHWSGHTDRNYGVSHFDQIQYMFTTPYFNETAEGQDTEFGKEFVKGMANFISQGLPPSPKWKPLTMEMADGETPLLYNRIGSSEDIVMEEPFTERVKFWDSQFLLEMERENIVNSLTTESEATETISSNVEKDEL